MLHHDMAMTVGSNKLCHFIAVDIYFVPLCWLERAAWKLWQMHLRKSGTPTFPNSRDGPSWGYNSGSGKSQDHSGVVSSPGAGASNDIPHTALEHRGFPCIQTCTPLISRECLWKWGKLRLPAFKGGYIYLQVGNIACRPAKSYYSTADPLHLTMSVSNLKDLERFLPLSLHTQIFTACGFSLFVLLKNA